MLPYWLFSCVWVSLIRRASLSCFMNSYDYSVHWSVSQSGVLGSWHRLYWKLHVKHRRLRACFCSRLGCLCCSISKWVNDVAHIPVWMLKPFEVKLPPVWKFGSSVHTWLDVLDYIIMGSFLTSFTLCSRDYMVTAKSFSRGCTEEATKGKTAASGFLFSDQSGPTRLRPSLVRGQRTRRPFWLYLTQVPFRGKSASGLWLCLQPSTWTVQPHEEQKRKKHERPRMWEADWRWSFVGCVHICHGNILRLVLLRWSRTIEVVPS
jgi:hypothetical protein